MTPLSHIVQFVQDHYMGMLLSVFVVYCLYLRYIIVLSQRSFSILLREAHEMRKEIICLMAEVASSNKGRGKS